MKDETITLEQFMAEPGKYLRACAQDDETPCISAPEGEFVIMTRETFELADEIIREHARELEQVTLQYQRQVERVENLMKMMGNRIGRPDVMN